MTLFTPEINSIEEDILYHETQIKEAEERLDQVKMSQAYSDTVISSLEDFMDNTDPFLYEVLRGHLNQMFDGNKITLNNDFKQVKKEEVFTSPVVEDAETGPKVFNPLQPATLDSIDAGTNIPHTQDEDEEAHLIHLTDNVVFDEDTDCIHIGFRLSSDGYEWQDQLVYKQKLSTKSWFEEAEHLEDYPKELIIEGLSLEQAKEITLFI